MTYIRKKRVLGIIRRSALTGRAVWVSHRRIYQAEWEAYKRACLQEINRMRQWVNTVNRRRRNVTRLISELTDRIPILGDVPQDKREAAKILTQLADKEPVKQSDFYEHICEEKRQRRNASRRTRRWQEKYGAKESKI